MQVDMHRDSAKFIDDAHALNALICKGRNGLSDDFIYSWHHAYKQYCSLREPIELVQGIDA